MRPRNLFGVFVDMLVPSQENIPALKGNQYQSIISMMTADESPCSIKNNLALNAHRCRAKTKETARAALNVTPPMKGKCPSRHASRETHLDSFRSASSF
jgi:hypothetical protein